MNHLYPFLVAAGLWLTASAAAAQTYFNQRHAQIIPGAQTTLGCVIPHSSGYAVAGVVYDNPTPADASIMLGFLDTHGQLTHSRYYGQAGYIYQCGSGNAFQRLPDGGYVLVGNRVAPIIPRLGATMIWRFNAQGDTLWTRTYRQLLGEVSLGVSVLANGGLLLVGSTTVLSNGFSQVLLTCTDSLGRIKWWRTHGTALQTDGRSIIPTPDGGFLIGGLGYENQQTDAYVAKVDSVGNLLWEHYLGSSTLSDTRAVVSVQLDGSYVVAASCGVRHSGNIQYRRHFVYHFAPDGRQLSRRAYGSEGVSLNLYAIQSLPDGSVVIAGQQDDTTAQAKPVAVAFKLCGNGDSIWYHTYKILRGSDSHHYLGDLRTTSDGGFVAAGLIWTFPPDSGTSDGWVFKIDSAGYMQAGGTPPTVRCRRVTATAPEISDRPEVELYPNPTLPDGRFTLQAPSGATATLTDALGREVWRTSHLEPLTSDLALPHPGLYLLRISFADGRTLTRKLVR